MNLQLAELEKRNKELNAKEAYIDEKLRLLEDAPINLKVYEAQVVAKEKQLKDLQDGIAEQQDKWISIEAVHRQNVRIYEGQINDLMAILSEKKSLVKHYDDLIMPKIAKLADVKDEIKERKTYLDGQEAAIEHTLSDGNEKLLDLHNDIGAAELKLTDAKSDFITKQDELDDLLIVIDEQESAFELTTANQEALKKKLATDVKETQDKLIEATKKLDGILKEYKDKMKMLQEKEESIVAKLDAIKLEQQTLTQQRRQFQATRTLYET